MSSGDGMGLMSSSLSVSRGAMSWSPGLDANSHPAIRAGGESSWKARGGDAMLRHGVLGLVASNSKTVLGVASIDLSIWVGRAIYHILHRPLGCDTYLKTRPYSPEKERLHAHTHSVLGAWTFDKNRELFKLLEWSSASTQTVPRSGWGVDLKYV